MPKTVPFCSKVKEKQKRKNFICYGTEWNKMEQKKAKSNNKEIYK